MKIILILIISMFLYADENVDSQKVGDYEKGRTFYFHLFRESLGYDGVVFTARHKELEWAKMFEDDAREFKEYLVNENSDLKELLYSEKFDKSIKNHMEAFVRHYANDTGNIPICGSFEFE